MDFTFNDEQLAVAGLAERVFEGEATVERIKESERSSDRFDRELWRHLAAAGLLGISLPEEVGGSGLGTVELGLVLERQGMHVASLPLLWSTLAAMTLAEFAPEALGATLLPTVVTGETVLTCGLEHAGDVDATLTDIGWSLEGARLCVPWAHVASRVLISATSNNRSVLVLVDPSAEGVTSELADATDRQLLTHLTFDGTPCELVAGSEQGERPIRWVMERGLTGLCALQCGVAQAALAATADYTSNRTQFGRPLSTFQSVSARAADAFIDIAAMQATLWQAAWRLDAGLDASVEVAIAKWWASEAGDRVVHATQHLHGGIGADIDYPVHRYYLWGKQIANTLGGASEQLARIGAAVAVGAHR